MKHSPCRSSLHCEPDHASGLAGALSLGDASHNIPADLDDLSKLDNLALLSYKLYMGYWFGWWGNDEDQARTLFQEAYEMARDNKEFGPHYCFSVMHECYRRFDDLAMKMWQELTEAAEETNDIGILRIMWRFLGHVSTHERPVWRTALELRRAIAARHPQVMKYRRTDRSWS